ncbi:hypothetical protein [Kluyvera sp. CRP]|uniref:hypothetical protein n=1 Tax=Kluyvera sp. CRP TaxID=2873269 RepID=UPI001CC1E9FB|nr:hypothetical protein [Kluyvera sp. CRP]UAK18627.1 hypothetical protein K7B04_14925 [Kluyvera sp. CRP]
MTTNLTAPQAPVTDEELDQMIWKLERDGGMAPKLLSLMRELRALRKAREVVIPLIWKHYTGAQVASIYELAMTEANVNWRFLSGA